MTSAGSRHFLLQEKGHHPMKKPISWRAALALGVVTLLGFAVVAVPARAELNLDITRGKVEPMPIALPDFSGTNPQETEVGHNITQVVSADLERSGLFRPLDPKSFIQDAASLKPLPRFADWRLINAQALVSGGAETQPDGRFKVEFRLWDVLAGQQIAGFAYYTHRPHHRRRDLQTDHRRGWLFRYARRLHRRKRPGRSSGQAAFHHGSGRFQ
jgi:hypothetical protein